MDCLIANSFVRLQLGKERFDDWFNWTQNYPTVKS